MTTEVLALRGEIRRLQVELAVRTSNPASPRFQADVPERFKGQTTAFRSGYERGWRNLEYVNPYSSSAHETAYYAGFRAGEAESLEAIGRFLVGSEAVRDAAPQAETPAKESGVLCPHARCDEDGICRACGTDCRGIDAR